MPIVTMASPYTIAGCPFTGANGPCVTAQWVVGAVRVFSMGQPVVIMTGVSICAPTGTPLIAVQVQPRVIAT
jgi:hypothetical protein